MTSAPAPIPALEWTPDLSVGDLDLDQQHTELFRRAERLVLALSTGGREEVDPLVHSFSDFLRSHLTCEERWMVGAEYPGLAAHLDAHWRFKDEVDARTRIYQRRGPSPAMGRAIRAWLAGWLYPHLGGPDLQLGCWLALHASRQG